MEWGVVEVPLGEGRRLRLYHLDDGSWLDLLPGCSPGQLVLLEMVDAAGVYWKRFMMVRQGMQEPTAKARVTAVLPAGVEPRLTFREAAELDETDADALQRDFLAAQEEDPSALAEWHRWAEKALGAGHHSVAITATLEQIRRAAQSGGARRTTFAGMLPKAAKLPSRRDLLRWFARRSVAPPGPLPSRPVRGDRTDRGNFGIAGLAGAS